MKGGTDNKIDLEVLRTRLRKMNYQGLRRFGLAAMFMCSAGAKLGKPNCMAQSTMVPWLTRSADNSRSGWNSRESKLPQAAVENKGIVRATIIPVVGDARGMEAQPLVLPKVKIPNQRTMIF